MENDQCCGNCKWQNFGRCVRHHAFLHKQDLSAFVCDDYISEAQMDMEDLDDEVRIEEIERK